MPGTTPSRGAGPRAPRSGQSNGHQRDLDAALMSAGRVTDHDATGQARAPVEGAGFERYRFLPTALPEIDLADVDVATTVLGRELRAPIVLPRLPDGTPGADRTNAVLAQAAAELGLALGLGTVREPLEGPTEHVSLPVHAGVPGVLLFANLAAARLNRGLTSDDCRRLLDASGAQALVLHLNSLQEALWSDEDRGFAGLLARIEDLCARLGRPVLASEAGSGLTPDVVRALMDCGVAGVGLAGALRGAAGRPTRIGSDAPGRQRLASTFTSWGVPTAEALRQARHAAPDALVFVSGGVSDGVDLAKAIALGADLVAPSGLFLQAAEEGLEATVELGRELITALRICLFCTGARSLAELRTAPRLAGDGLSVPRVHSETQRYETTGPGQFLDITEDVRQVVVRSGVRDGQVQVFSHHTTAAVRINENEPLLLQDFRDLFDRLVPAGGYLHDDMSRRPSVPADEPVNGHAHCRHLLLSSGETLPVVAGTLGLGRWQRVFLIELCSPRLRHLTVQVIGQGW